MTLPRYIGICGHPKSGKSLVQEFLLQHFGVQPVDDGFALRDIAIRHYGAKPEDVETQEGKARLAFWPNGDPIMNNMTGNHMTWRQVLGEIGKCLERLIGPYVMPMMAVSRLPLDGGPFSFGSVRMEQGRYWKEHGGAIIGIRNPLAGPTGNDFDLFNESLVDVWVENDAIARGLSVHNARQDLAAKVCDAVAAIVPQVVSPTIAWTLENAPLVVDEQAAKIGIF